MSPLWNFPDKDKDEYDRAHYERYVKGEGRPYRHTILPTPEELIKRARLRDEIRRAQARDAQLDLFWRQAGLGLEVVIVGGIMLLLVLAILKPAWLF